MPHQIGAPVSTPNQYKRHFHLFRENQKQRRRWKNKPESGSSKSWMEEETEPSCWFMAGSKVIGHGQQTWKRYPILFKNWIIIHRCLFFFSLCIFFFNVRCSYIFFHAKPEQAQPFFRLRLCDSTNILLVHSPFEKSDHVNRISHSSRPSIRTCPIESK